MTIPANLIQETAGIGALPRVLCFGPQGGPYTVVSAVNPLPVISGIPANVAPSDAEANAAWLPTSAHNALWNGSAWDRQRGIEEGTLLPLAARTVTVAVDLTNRNANALLLTLRMTVVPAAPGTGGLQVQLYARDPVSGVANFLSAVSPTRTTVAQPMLLYGPSTTYTSAPAVIQQTTLILPRALVVQVNHLDAQSYTYSLGYALCF